MVAPKVLFFGDGVGASATTTIGDGVVGIIIKNALSLKMNYLSLDHIESNLLWHQPIKFMYQE